MDNSNLFNETTVDEKIALVLGTDIMHANQNPRFLFPQFVLLAISR